MTNNDELRAYEISNQLRHLADNEIDSDSFAVVIENYNGREVDFERPITELAFEAAELVDALLAERDADKRRIAELEARTVAHDVGVMNIGNPYCEDHLIAWTVTGRQLAEGIYYLDARRVGDIKLEVEEV